PLAVVSFGKRRWWAPGHGIVHGFCEVPHQLLVISRSQPQNFTTADVVAVFLTATCEWIGALHQLWLPYAARERLSVDAKVLQALLPAVVVPLGVDCDGKRKLAFRLLILS